MIGNNKGKCKRNRDKSVLVGLFLDEPESQGMESPERIPRRSVAGTFYFIAFSKLMCVYKLKSYKETSSFKRYTVIVYRAFSMKNCICTKFAFNRKESFTSTITFVRQQLQEQELRNTSFYFLFISWCA